MKQVRWLVGVVTVLGVAALWQVGVSAQSKGLDTSAGEAVYTSSCVACHQATGAGVPGAFPPLAGTVPAFFQKGDAGRTSLEHIVIFGTTGAITVSGQTFNGQMPTWGKILSDQEITDVLNYVSTAWGNDAQLPKDWKPFTLDEVKAAHGAADLTPQQTHEERQKLGL
jgi:mono/diheme cytochrome c family protein